MKYGSGEKTCEEIRALAREHRAKDLLIQGSFVAYFQDDVKKGCSIGCMLGFGRNHFLAPEILGISTEVAHLVDFFFESHSLLDAKDFHVAFYETLPDGADTTLLHYKYLSAVFKELSTKQVGDIEILSNSSIEYIHAVCLADDIAEFDEQTSYEQLPYFAPQLGVRVSRRICEDFPKTMPVETLRSIFMQVVADCK